MEILQWTFDLLHSRWYIKWEFIQWCNHTIYTFSQECIFKSLIQLRLCTSILHPIILSANPVVIVAIGWSFVFCTFRLSASAPSQRTQKPKLTKSTGQAQECFHKTVASHTGPYSKKQFIPPRWHSFNASIWTTSASMKIILMKLTASELSGMIYQHSVTELFWLEIPSNRWSSLVFSPYQWYLSTGPIFFLDSTSLSINFFSFMPAVAMGLWLSTDVQFISKWLFLFEANYQPLATTESVLWNFFTTLNISWGDIPLGTHNVVTVS